MEIVNTWGKNYRGIMEKSVGLDMGRTLIIYMYINMSIDMYIDVHDVRRQDVDVRVGVGV